MALVTMGEKLRTLRTEKGLSLRALASVCGCSHVYVHDLETGIKTPSASMRARLESALGASLRVMTDAERLVLADLVAKYGLAEVRSEAGWPS